MSTPDGSGGRLSRLFRWLLPGDLGAEACDIMDRQHRERRARLGAAAAWLRHAAHLLHPHTWRLAILLRRRLPGHPSAGWRWGISWLDVKLGLRMLRRNPGLTFVALFALSIGIPASLIPIHAIDAMTAPLPFDEGHRIVGIYNRNVAEGRRDFRMLHDFFVWREELTTVEGLAAERSGPYNVIDEDGRAAPVRGAEMTATGFQALRVPPLMGRVLLESDEVPGAPDVVVISHDLWQSRLGGDPDVLGRSISIGNEPHEVVGVMPEGFLFPMRDHLWLAFRYGSTDFERGQGPIVYVFGRLADGSSLEEARAELKTVGARLTRAYPDTHGRLRPHVSGYTESIWGIGADDRFWIWMTELAALAVLMVVCGNVGILVLARTAMRSGEIAVRTALGASRSRIVSQLFVEALVLAVGAAGIGLILADFIATRFQQDVAVLAGPFWLDLGVKPRSVVIALSVAALCAVVSGVLPALRATGKGVRRNLQGTTAGSGVSFGRASTLLIVTEVAMAVGLLTFGTSLTYALATDRSGVGQVSEIDTDEYLMATLTIPRPAPGAGDTDADGSAFRDRVAATVTELRNRLDREPGARGLAIGSSLPHTDHPVVRVEVEGDDGGSEAGGHRVRRATVDIGFFDGLGAKILHGRDFTAADVVAAPEERAPVIVNTGFVEEVLGGRNALGRRVRYAVSPGQEPGPWYEIVGVVGPLGMNALSPSRDQGLYHPAASGELHPVWMAIRVGDEPLGFLPRLRRIAAEVDPAATVQYADVLSDAPNMERAANLYGFLLLAFLCVMAIVLSGAGLYALMSFTVSHRTREIGIRTALGALPARIVVAIGRRAFLQLLAGTVVGAVMGGLLMYAVREADIPGPDPLLTVAACSGIMMVVGMLACLQPTLRGLRIEPVEALKEG